MSRKRSKAKRTSRAGRSSSGPPAWWFLLRRAAPGLGTLALMGGLVLAAAWGTARLEAGAGARRAAGDAPPPIDLPGAIVLPWHEPRLAWPPAPLLARLKGDARAILESDRSPYSIDAVRRIGRHLAQSGLFERTPRVRRLNGGGVGVEGSWRPAAAAVRHKGKDQLVGPDAVVLPVAYNPGESDFRVILGAAFDPPQHDGRILHGAAWPGDDVRDALLLLALLRDEAFWPQVRGVDVSGHALGTGLVLLTSTGGRVEWGAAPGVFRPGEVSARRKVENLRALYDRFGRIDAGMPRIRVMHEYVSVDETERAGGS